MTSSTLSRPLTLGYVQLTDSAPLLMAKRLGMFERYGLDVQLLPQPSWSTLRDRLDAGMLDAAQLLAPMPLANRLGLTGSQQPLLTPMILSQNGNALTLSNALVSEITQASGQIALHFPLSAAPLQAVIDERKRLGKPPITLACVFHYSCHRYQLLDWLRQGGIEVADIRLVIIPPVMMAESLEAGTIDGFCVGGPYNAKSVRAEQGQTVVTSFDIWEDKLEKVLGVTRNFHHKNEVAVHALCAAILDACEWLREIPNRFEAARYLAREDVLNESLDVIGPSLIGSCLTKADEKPRHIPHYNRFSSVFSVNTLNDYQVNTPTRSQALWLLEKMQAYESEDSLNGANIEEVAKLAFRDDIFAAAVDMRTQLRTSK
ncbi:CmpA/NrtA family ABC transporter substrate-binding protein [Glaciecola sp. SC05]|uniref:CmpA/NrtA family ABC transporter substrate-binding protein n=1 Tax=Glaciecola sp. SC05 TaxID=1987355 RepID=UPI003529C938